MIKRNICMVTGIAAMMCLSTMSSAHAMSAQDFVTKASIANEFEIDSSKIALEKSRSNKVKSFAQRMVDDHTQTGEKMKGVLQSSHSPAKPATELDSRHQKLIDKLRMDRGSNFDRDYIGMQTDAHKEAVSLFSGYSKHGKNGALRDFAAQTLPTLQDHLKHVEALNTH